MNDSLRAFFSRLRAFFFKTSLDHDFGDELAAHIELLTEENIQRGMTPEEARRAAFIKLGGVEPAKELHRDTRSLPFLDSLLQDLRYTFRTLRRDIGFTTFAILIVGLGIGASATVFSVVNTLLIRPLPFRDPASLVWVANSPGALGLSGQTMQVGHFLDLREQNKSFSDMAAFFAFYGVGETMARQFWPGQNPIGKRLRPGPPSVQFTEVVGVVKNTRGARLWEADQPYVYLPILQATEGPPIQTEQMGMKLLIRTDGNPDSLSTMVQRVVRALDPNVQVSATTLGKSMERWVWFSQVGAMLLSGLGILGLFLASVGIYGVMSYSVTQRTHELGIRMALGADKPEILKLILRQGLRITLVGVAVGLLIALATTRVIAAVLYGVNPTDPATFGGVSLLLTAVALIASYLPARRATRVDPMVALRYE